MGLGSGLEFFVDEVFRAEGQPHEDHDGEDDDDEADVDREGSPFISCRPDSLAPVSDEVHHIPFQIRGFSLGRGT